MNIGETVAKNDLHALIEALTQVLLHSTEAQAAWVYLEQPVVQITWSPNSSQHWQIDLDQLVEHLAQSGEVVTYHTSTDDQLLKVYAASIISASNTVLGWIALGTTATSAPETLPAAVQTSACLLACVLSLTQHSTGILDLAQAQLLNQLNDGVIISNAAGEIIYVNQAASLLHGVHQLNVAVEDYSSTYHLYTMDDQPYPEHELPLARAVLHGETVINALWKIHRPDGTIVIAKGNAIPIINEEQIGALLVIRDISEQHHEHLQREQLLRDRNAALEALTAVNAQLQLLMTATTSLSQTLDLTELLHHTTAIFVPLLFERISFVLCESDWANQWIAARLIEQQPTLEAVSLTPEHTASIIETCGRAISSWHAPVSAVLQPFADSAESILISIPLLAHGTTLGILFGHNPTAIADQELLLHALGKRVAVAFENARLYDQAQQAIIEREQYLSIILHELRTPLTSLKGYADLLLRRFRNRSDVQERDQRAVEQVAHQAGRMDKLTRVLFDLSLIERGTLQLQSTNVDIIRLIQDVIAEIQPTTTHTIELHTTATPLLLYGDGLRLEQVIRNLLSNAIKYSAPATIVSITVDSSDQQLRIIIQDQGIGIPPEALKHIWSRFYRATNTIQRNVTGIGIGLYVVREIITLHGGTVHVASVLDQGSTFTITLPRLQA